jgi:SAM-dependent methyltransferase
MRFRQVLDVGCGAGHSTVAFSAVADHVTGMDVAPEMLQRAEASSRVSYRLGRAEALEFADAQFDLVTVASALHWFDQPRFYAECRRVLAPEGWLLVYNDHFTSHAPAVPEVKSWMRSAFARRYPVPRRGMRDIDEVAAVAGGFQVVRRGSFEHLVSFARQEFIAYLLTRSNTLAAVERGRETADSAAQWMDAELSLILPDAQRAEFLFKCNLWLLRPQVRGADAARHADAVK